MSRVVAWVDKLHMLYNCIDLESCPVVGYECMAGHGMAFLLFLGLGKMMQK